MDKNEKKLAKRLAREQMRVWIKKDTLAREKALDDLSLKKIKDKWLEAVISTKVPEMQNNMKYILHYMERLIETENFRKALFENERDELEEQSALMAQSHRSALEILFDIYEKRIQDLHSAYNDKVNQKKTQAESEFQEIDAQERETKENLLTILFQKQQNRDKTEDMMNCDMFLKLDDEKSKIAEKQESLRTRLEKKMERRWDDITTTLKNYELNTKIRRAEYIRLKAKDDADSKIIHQQMKKTQKLLAQLEELKKCADDFYLPPERIIFLENLKEEKNVFYQTFKLLKGILSEEMLEDEYKMKALTATTHDLIEDMSKLRSKGEKILTVYRICLRLETEMEKVLPVGGHFNAPKQSEGIKNRKSKAKAENEELLTYQEGGQQTKDFLVLEKFWKKVAKVLISKMSLRKCIENMEKENKYLRAMLSSYMKESSGKPPNKLQ